MSGEPLLHGTPKVTIFTEGLLEAGTYGQYKQANILGSRQWEPSAALLAWVASSVELAIICMYEDIYLVQEKPMQN